MSYSTQAYIISDLDGCLAMNGHRAALVPQGDDRDSAEAWRTYVMGCGDDAVNLFVANLLTYRLPRPRVCHHVLYRAYGVQP